MTMTGSRLSSAAAVQPLPYSNGTSNMAKKSAEVARERTWCGRFSAVPPVTIELTLYIMTLRSGMSDRDRNFASLYVIISGASPGCRGSYTSFGSQLTMVTAYSRSPFHQIGLPDIAWKTVIVITHTAMPCVFVLSLWVVCPGLRWL